MNITDTIDALARDVHTGRNIEETIDAYINTHDGETHAQILDEIGDVDLSEPRPDLSAGWFRVRAQLAYNALRAAVASAARELADEGACIVCGHVDAGHTCCSSRDVVCFADPDDADYSLCDVEILDGKLHTEDFALVTCPHCLVRYRGDYTTRETNETRAMVAAICGVSVDEDAPDCPKCAGALRLCDTHEDDEDEPRCAHCDACGWCGDV